MKKVFSLLMILLASTSSLWAQCAMCRASVENNVSNGDIGIGAGLNFGIMYLFVAPYIAVSVVAFYWYKHSKKEAKHEQNKRNFRRKMPQM